MIKDLKCPKCGGEMERGISTEGWTNKFFTLRPKWIDRYRCKSCGFIEQYAPDRN